MLSMFAAPVNAQWIVVEPGQVLAGKTLLSASQPHLDDQYWETNLVFVGEFDEAPEDDIVDLRQGVFTMNVFTGDAKLLAWTGNTELGGIPITEIGSPQINSAGRIMYRVATPSVSAILDEDGAVVAQQGKSIAPGVLLGQIEDFALSDGECWVIDGAGFYDVLHKSVVSRLPMRLEGYYVTQPRNLDLGGVITYTDRNSIFSFPGGRALVPGDVFEGHRIQRGISMSTGSFATAFVAASDGKTGLFYSESWPVPFGELVLQEGDLVGNKVISDIGPEIKLTKHGRLVFSASLDGRQSILMVPEPTTMVLALMALIAVMLPMLRRSR